MSDNPFFEDTPSPAPQIVPHNREAEEALLGSVLINPDAYYDVAPFLKPEDFYIHRHRWIWEVFTRLHERRVPIDFLTVKSELEQLGQLNEAGGPAYLSSLINNVPTSLHAETYGHLVEQTGIRRRMLEAANQIARLAYQEELPVETVMDEAEKQVFGVSERRSTRDVSTIQMVLSDYYDRIDDLSKRDDEIFGVPTGFIDLDRLLGGLQGSDLLIIAGRPGMGKCVTSDTRILDPDNGELIAIETLVQRRQARLLTLSEHYTLQASQASDFVDDGIKPVYRVRTALGREIKVTLSHPFLTIQGWKPLGELGIGDAVAVPRVIPVFGQDDMPDHELIVLAFLLADGNLTGVSPRFTNKDLRLRADFSSAALHFPGVMVKTRDDHSNRTPTVYVVSDLEQVKSNRRAFAQALTQAMQRVNWTCTCLATELGVSRSLVSQWRAGTCVPENSTFARLCALLEVLPEQLAAHGLEAMSWKGPNSLRRWLEHTGVWGKRAAEKDVPDCIYRLPRPKLALFLNRLFASDGSIYLQHGAQVAVSYATVSVNLAHAVQHLLLRFGILSKLRYRQVMYQGTHRPAYELRIIGAEQVDAFLSQIGAFGKEQAAEKACQRIAVSNTNPNLDVIPAGVWEAITQIKGQRTWRSIVQAMGLPTRTNIHVGKRAPSRQRLLSLGQVLESDWLLDLARSDVYWDKITEIEYLGERQVYDLTVPGTHNFVADDMIVHNTAFMLTVAKHAAQLHKKHVAIFSLEMANEQLVQRLISQETGIDSHRLRTGKLTEDEWPVFTHAVEVLSGTRIFLDDTPSLTPLQMRTKCRRLHLEYGLDLVVVDYLQLMSSGSRSENRVQEVSYISRNMKVLARELNVPVLAAAQLSRAIEQRADKEPQLSDLRESGSLEQDADIVMFIHRPEMYEKDKLKQNVAQIKIAKHRNGPVGMVELIFRSNLARFENAAPRHMDLKQI